MLQEDHLRMALGIILNTGSKVNGTQLEFLKGALAQFQHNITSDKSLVTAAEQILTTITNPNWVDREIMRQYFLDTAGFGSELSLSSASLCIDRGIPSPQQLAAFIHVTPVTEVLHWLGITQVQFMLLKIAVKPYLEQIAQACCGDRDVVPRMLAEVWVEVGSVDQDECDDVNARIHGSEGGDDTEEGSEVGELSECSPPAVQVSLGVCDALCVAPPDTNITPVSTGDGIALVHVWEESSVSSYDQAQLSPPPPTCTLCPLSPVCCAEGFLHTSASASASIAGSCDGQSVGSWEHTGLGEGVYEEVRSTESWSAYSPVESPISYIHYDSSEEGAGDAAEGDAVSDDSGDDLSSSWSADARWPCIDIDAASYTASYTASSALLDSPCCCSPDHSPCPGSKCCVGESPDTDPLSGLPLRVSLSIA